MPDVQAPRCSFRIAAVRASHSISDARTEALRDFAAVCDFWFKVRFKGDGFPLTSWFCHKVSMKKYGRTFHLPTSPGVGNDDKIIQDLTQLQAAHEVVFTEKMDGENTTVFAGGCHARSPDSGYHVSRDWMKAYAAGLSPSLADDERIVGEYLFAKHSVSYDDLPSYFLGFAWIVGDEMQGWDGTIDRFEELGIQPVPVLHRGQFDDATVKTVLESLDLQKQEGFVVRSVSSFFESEMATHIAKYVREGHVQSDTHWTKAEIIKNGLRSSS